MPGVSLGRRDSLADRGGGVQLNTRSHRGSREHLIAARAIAGYLLANGLIRRHTAGRCAGCVQNHIRHEPGTNGNNRSSRRGLVKQSASR